MKDRALPLVFLKKTWGLGQFFFHRGPRRNLVTGPRTMHVVKPWRRQLLDPTMWCLQTMTQLPQVTSGLPCNL